MKNQGVTFFLPSLQGGGAEKGTLLLARKFVAEGTKVDLILARAKGSLIDNIPKGIYVRNFGVSRDASAIFKLARYLRREQPEVMLVSLRVASVVALLARTIARTSTRIIVANPSVSGGPVRNWRGGWVVPLLRRLIYRSVDHFIAVSHKEAQDLLDSFPYLSEDKVTVVYNPVVDEKLTRKSREALNHPWFDPGREQPVLLAVGRLTYLKNFSLLIRAFKLVRKRINGRLVILGEGEQRNKLEHLIKRLGLTKYVEMPGFVENPYKFMSRADVFVLSSRSETFGNVLVEAMAVGTPVVSTDCGGPSEILENGRYGKLVPVGDASALAKGIVSILGDSVDSQRLKERANFFSAERAFAQYKAILFDDDLR